MLLYALIMSRYENLLYTLSNWLIFLSGLQVGNDFLPILMYVRATDGTVAGAPKAEIIFSRECESVLLKLRNFSGSAMMADKEKLFKSLIPAMDGKGKRVRDDLYTTEAVELAMERYAYTFFHQF